MERLGAEFIRAQPIFQHVGVTINAVFGEMPATDHAPVVAADPAANEVDAIKANEPLRSSRNKLWQHFYPHVAPGVSGAAIYAEAGYKSTVRSEPGNGAADFASGRIAG